MQQWCVEMQQCRVVMQQWYVVMQQDALLCTNGTLLCSKTRSYAVMMRCNAAKRVVMYQSDTGQTSGGSYYLPKVFVKFSKNFRLVKFRVNRATWMADPWDVKKITFSILIFPFEMHGLLSDFIISTVSCLNLVLLKSVLKGMNMCQSNRACNIFVCFWQFLGIPSVCILLPKSCFEVFGLTH
jgi:hypothetical protein